MTKLIDGVILPNRRGRIVAGCLTCNEKLIKRWKQSTKYCSIKCQKEYQFNIKYLNWLAGRASWKDRKGLKRAVIRRFGYFCFECKIVDWNGKSIVLELEHKDGDSSNDKPDNLALICPNCHSQTDTFKGRNKGKGRHYRRLRYKEGKSY